MTLPFMTAEQAAELIQHGDVLGLGGFTATGVPKAVPFALAQRAERLHAEGKPFRVGLETGASMVKSGEKYEPILRSDKEYPEVTPYSVSMGVLMAVIFSAAAAYLGLKVGQVFEAAIPIAIIAVSLSSVLKRKNALGENVMIQSIGASSGVIVAGAIFTLPALYILQAKYPEMTVTFSQIFLSSLLGGCLGILFLIPFRRYFVKEKHGEYPFPEATATTQVLISGEEDETVKEKSESASSAKPLLWAAAIGGLYDFVVSTFGLWTEQLSTRMMGWGEALAAKTKLVFSINTSAAVLGLGYIIGLKYAAIICAGSFFVWWVLLPLMGSMPGMETVDPQVLFTVAENQVISILTGGTEDQFLDLVRDNKIDLAKPVYLMVSESR